MEFVAVTAMIVGTIAVFGITAYVASVLILGVGRGLRSLAYAVAEFGNLEARLADAEAYTYGAASRRETENLWREIEHIHSIKQDKTVKTKKKS